MKNIYINGSYLSDESIEYIFKGNNVSQTYNIYYNKPKKGKYYWIQYILYNFFINLFSKKRYKSDIQIFNSIVGCFFYSKNKKDVIIVHSYDIGIGTEKLLNNSNSKIKKIIINIIDFFIGSYIFRQLSKFEKIYCATYDRYFYLKNKGLAVIFLPNIVNEIPKKIVKNKEKYDLLNIFCPERNEKNKGIEFRKKIILHIHKNYKDTKFLFLNRGFDNNVFKDWCTKNKLNVTWLNYMTENELHLKMKQSDLVLGIFNNGALSMTNMECMINKVPIITYDKWEILKNDLDDEIIEYTDKLIQNHDFKNQEILKNYKYIKEVHSIDNYKKLLNDI